MNLKELLRKEKTWHICPNGRIEDKKGKIPMNPTWKKPTIKQKLK